MTWTVLALGEVSQWLRSLDRDSYIRVSSAIEALRAQGPNLGTPYVKPIRSSRHKNMKELRVTYGSRHFRILFAFDPKRQAIFLAAGDKSEVGWDEFYEKHVPIADDLFTAHVEEVKKQMDKEKKQSSKSNTAKEKSRKRK